jgi:hypothetical protein
MQLYRIDGAGKNLIAEIHNDRVVFLHPSIQRVINLQKYVVLPAIRPLMDRFGGSNKIPLDHPKFAKAVEIYLNNEIVTRAPSFFEWINGS